MKISLALVALGGAVALLAGCSSASTGGSALPATTSTSTGSAGTGSSAVPSAAVSALSGDPGLADSGSLGAGGAPGSSQDPGTTSESADPSSAEESSTGSSSAESPTSTSAAKVLDAASTKWLTTYCTSFQPILGLSGLSGQITAATGNLPKIRTLLLHAFQTAGGALTTTASKLKGLPAPSLTKAGSDLPGLLTKVRTLGSLLTADGKKIAAIDPTKSRQAFATAVEKYSPDLNKVSVELGTGAGLKIPFAALTEIKSIASCTKVITFA